MLPGVFSVAPHDGQYEDTEQEQSMRIEGHSATCGGGGGRTLCGGASRGVGQIQRTSRQGDIEGTKGIAVDRSPSKEDSEGSGSVPIPGGVDIRNCEGTPDDITHHLTSNVCHIQVQLSERSIRVTVVSLNCAGEEASVVGGVLSTDEKRGPIWRCS